MQGDLAQRRLLKQIENKLVSRNGENSRPNYKKKKRTSQKESVEEVWGIQNEDFYIVNFFFFTISSIIFFHFYSSSLFCPLPQTSTLIICPYVYIPVKCVGVCRIVCLNVNKWYCAVELMSFFLSPHHVAVSTKIDM